MSNSIKKAITYGFGNVLACYSYTLFMPFLIFISREFFPVDNTELNIVVGLAVFGCGLITRPIGSYVFGRIGDLICTEKAIGISYLLLAISTMAIGFIPSYDKCGILSSVLAILARSLQGIAMGGAGNVSLIQLIEIAPAKYKGLIGCIPNASNLIGLLISNVIFSLLYCGIDDVQNTVYWRMPFLVCIGLLFFSFLQFKEIKCFKRTDGMKLSSNVIKEYKLEIFCTFLFTALSAMCYYFVFAFLPNYMLSHFGGSAINVVTATNIVMVISVFIGGYLSDKFGRLPILFSVFGAIFVTGIIPMCFAPESAIKLLIPALSMALSAYYGVSGAFFSSLFPAGIRCTAIAFTMSISQAVFGSTTSLIANALSAHSFSIVTIPMMCVCVVSVFVLWWIVVKHRRSHLVA